ncbi:hypothetical protein R1flu_018666 [Riccia fluitans]|uniref:GPI ethanolamine phosphate transferase 2 C-terminal domain-containing protein n=1 Tax=Riccia fluitans TaxID=41844 RepID=A0ABD1ZGN5_9MARC
MASVFVKFASLGGLALLLQMTGLVLFVLGFFPVKPTLDGISGVESFNPGCEFDGYDKIDKPLHMYGADSREKNVGFLAKYDRLVFMVIDGLPAEFILGRDGKPPARDLQLAMPYTQNLMATGSALGYHAKAAPPTVTMPRLKAMTSGAIAGFLDVAYNFNTKELLEDNLIDQLARAGWRMVMLGDETWLKLFPNRFDRHDGVSSFYVKDTVEVDNNVTRHLDVELGKNDWRLLVLHYLGLDHVGHIGGRSSPLMVTKLREMDEIIARIYRTVLSRSPRTLLVVVSDHGMTDGGNHGGATYQEADALALFITKSFSDPESKTAAEASASRHHSDSEAYQVDLVPTLALLLGIPIPKNSVGALLQPLFSSSTPKLQLRALELNSWQLLRITRKRSPRSKCIADICRGGKMASDINQSAFSSGNGNEAHDLCRKFSLAMEKHKQWAQSGESSSAFEEAKHAYLQFLQPTSVWLASGSTEKLISFAVSGASLMLLSTIIFITGVFQLSKTSSRGLKSGASKQAASPLVKLVAIGGVCLHSASFGSSSFVEEEQFTWHFMLSTFFVVLLRDAFQQLKPVNTKSGHQQGKHDNRESAAKRKCSQFFQSWLNLKSPDLQFQDPKLKSTVKEVLQICLLLTFARTLRSWHRSGVNWAHLPDVAKTLENTHPSLTAWIRAGSLLIVSLICRWLVPKTLPRFIRRVTEASLTLTAVLVLFYYTCDLLRLAYRSDIWKVEAWATISAQGIYLLLGATFVSTFTLFPWLIVCKSGTESSLSFKKRKGALYVMSLQEEPGTGPSLQAAVKRSMDATGTVFLSCWCLLQLLLQQPVNAAPLTLLLLQLLLTVNLFRTAQTSFPRWISILTQHWLGASGHFGLGNSNTLATVDVAGAYIGLSSHSTALSGTLAFFITYGSPLLYMQGLLLGTDQEKPEKRKDGSEVSENWLLEDILLPCYLPLAMNSVVLTVFTGVLYLMQDHLFVWSVFSPKYLYVVATTICTYLGTLIFATVGGYSFLVISKRMQRTKNAKNNRML